MVSVSSGKQTTEIHTRSGNVSGSITSSGNVSEYWANKAELSAEEAQRFAELAEYYAEQALSVIWIKVDSSDWEQFGEYYRHSIEGILAVISVYSGSWEYKELIEYNVTSTNLVTDVLVKSPINGYILASKAIIESEDYIPATMDNINQVNERIDGMVETIEGSGLIEVTRSGQSVTIESKTFVFEQSEASTEWVIVHNLNKNPTVVTVDSAGTQFQGRVIYDNSNQCTIYINGATKGKAYLN